MSASSSAVGAFSTLIDKLSQPGLNASEFVAPPANDGQKQSDARLAAHLVVHPSKAEVAADPLAAEKFLDDLDSWLTQAKRSTRSQTSAAVARPSTTNPKSSR